MNAADTKGFRWGVERRLEFVEFRLFWEGGVNRSDIVDEFGVSVPQASKDLALYQEHAPDNIVYDRSEKRYFASDAFRPRFIELDAAAYLDRLAPRPTATGAKPEDSAHGALVADRLPIPQRRVASNALRALLEAVRGNRSIEILYQSMSAARPEPVWRRVSPHAFASDGLRWHTRAYCHIDQKFKDFILSRCLDCRNIGEAGSFPRSDDLWNSHFQVILIPNPKLTACQQGVIAQDYAMMNGRVVVPVRHAMLYYFSKRLRLDLASSDPRETPVVVSNREEFDSALSEAMR
ncbi:helix-turn-helix transcriptional regulator [Methylocella tundrae]|uniref:Transcriptional regulator n=1 Tax=Methylocella tundrae TaxID=227605 RepID=A0A4U8Z8G0_METTU|nr:WYL domain-containing protein [Methylocella tundrae]WPP02707.1 WYL domain-containing protein [Methylocella tundrae]VFU17384.1 Transcriptional regulator [Methylocella tundrae]